MADGAAAPRHRRLVIALLRSRALIDAVRQCIPDAVRVLVCSDLWSLAQAVSVNSADNVLIELGPDVPVAEAIEEASRALTPTRIIGYCALSPPAMRAAAEAVRHGVSRIAIHGHDDLATYLQASDEEPGVGDVQVWVDRATRERTRGDVTTMLVCCLEVATRRGTVASLAGVLRVHRVTLARRFRRLGLPEPKVVLMRYRLLLAAGLLEHTTRPVAEVCSALGFGSYVVFRRALVRHTGLRPKSLRCHGQFDALTRIMIRSMVRPPRARLAGGPETQLHEHVTNV